MTQDELDALPECGGIGYRVEGNRRIPVMQKAFALYQGPDDPISIIDRNGQCWMTGWADGKQWKCKLRSL